MSNFGSSLCFQFIHWWYAFLLIIFLNSFKFLLPSFWTKNLLDWWCLFHDLFFQVIYLVLLIGSRSYTFLFYLTFSIFKNLGVTVICFGLEKVFFMWDCPCFVLFIIVDWNAKVGRKETPGVTGKLGFEVQKEAGQRLIEFCQENTLVIANTFF